MRAELFCFFIAANIEKRICHKDAKAQRSTKKNTKNSLFKKVLIFEDTKNVPIFANAQGCDAYEVKSGNRCSLTKNTVLASPKVLPRIIQIDRNKNAIVFFLLGELNCDNKETADWLRHFFSHRKRRLSQTI